MIQTILDAHADWVDPTLADGLVEIGARMDRMGWVPGSAGNLSARLSDQVIAITSSGVHKGLLRRSDIIPVDLGGQALRNGDRPSAETLLHCQLYARDPSIGAVLHGHSVAATVLSRHEPGDAIRLEGYEILKAFPGIRSHEAQVLLPVFDNDQDIARLAAQIAPTLNPAASIIPIGYVLRGHGVYAWGPDIERCFWRLEALEFLLRCELERRQIG
jgi:methylthioribulose-1-phosphate dehydratase